MDESKQDQKIALFFFSSFKPCRFWGGESLGGICLSGDQGDSTLRVSFLRSHAWTDLCGGSTLCCEKGPVVEL